MSVLLVGIGTASLLVIATHVLVVAAQLARQRSALRRRPVAADLPTPIAGQLLTTGSASIGRAD
ncbi:hypothetical protein [Nocardia brasiliensis]|uniref:hypothetical protein n=1 Tax=Nocardia brasiliensis TaxID=37326 RepID=UPI00366E8EC7